MNNAQLTSALSTLPMPLQTYLAPIVLAKNFDATLSKQQFIELLALSAMEDAQLRIALLPLAAAYSHAPISNFHVGAIVRGLSGRLYFGANLELSNVQLSQTVHAEQSAISHAWMKGEQGISDITINFSPCGHCRQFMNELTGADKLIIQLPQRQPQSLQQYLPESFGPKDLDIHLALMSKSELNFSVETSNELQAAALSGLNHSHAPYSNNFSGVALQVDSGEIYIGSYAENAAFNPSLAPLQVALIQLLLDNKQFGQIQSAVLIEMANNSVSHYDVMKAILFGFNKEIAFDYLTI